MKETLVAAALLSALCGCDELKVEPDRAEIVIPAKATKVVEYAAKELGDFLSQSFGREVPVVRKAAPNKVHFYLGDSPEARAAGIDVAPLKRDAFVVKVTDRDVFIAGRDDARQDPVKQIERGATSAQLYERATLFGVYAFLEEAVGCRFYFPGELGTIVPKKAALELPRGEKTVVPALLLRRPYSGGGDKGYDGAWFDASMKTASGKSLNWLRLRLTTAHIPCCHGLNDFGYLSRFAKTKPEYFALLSNGKRSNDRSQGHPGQLCMTSGIWEEIYQDTKSYLKGEKADVRGVTGYNGGKPHWGHNCVDGKYVDIMCQDGMMQCHCDKCQAAYNRGPEFGNYWATDIMWKCTVDVANRLIAEGIPGYVTQMAYGPYRKVPAIDIPTNVLVMVAERGPWSIVNKKQLEDGNREIREWTEKLHQQVWIWTYPGKYGSQRFPGVPNSTPKCVGDYYKMVMPYIFGTFMESESDRFLYNYFNYYLLSRLGWDADTDVDGVIAEHHRLMFGAAADEMAEFFRTVEDKWVKEIVGNSVDTELGPTTIPPTNKKLWGEIYSADVVAGLDALLDRAAAKVAAGSLEQKRIELFRREYLGQLKESAAAYKKHAEAVAKLTWDTKAGPLEVAVHYGEREKERYEHVKTTVSLDNRADAFVFTIVCDEPQVAKMVAPNRKSDEPEIWKDNGLELFLNTSGDGKTFYHIMLNSQGSLTDSKSVKAGSGFPLHDYKWNSGAKVNVTKGATSWTAVVEIPKAAFGPIQDRFPFEVLRNRNVEGVPLSYFKWSPFSRGIDEIENQGTLILK